MSNRRKATPAELEFITAAREGDRDRLHDAPDGNATRSETLVLQCD